MTKNKNVELLAPVGTFEALKAAVNNGCDAVYFGGKAFNARQYASNFSDKEVKNIIDYCHLRGVKVRITLNILYKNNEINPVLDFVAKLYSFGADALIIQDIGLFNIIKNNYPNMNLHASTQMTVHNKNGTEFLRFLGFNRVVLSRELSLEEIKEIRKSVDIELECFIHGAICVSYSGRCLMSSLIGERSGNRGRCAQPCRMRYKIMKRGENKPIKEGYLISPKDMSALPIVDELVNSGIDTFKIEGRMKSPEYVGLVTQKYRKYINETYDNSFKLEKGDLKEITQIFNRGGSSETGYYKNYAGLDMISKSPKSSGVKIGIVESYNKQKQSCVIKLEDNVYCGDGIEIWTRTEPHTGTNISKNGNKGDKITVKLQGNINKGDLVYKSFDKVLDDKLKHLYEKDTRQQEIKAELKAVAGEKIFLKLIFNDTVYAEVYGDVVENAQNNPTPKDRIIAQLSKTGSTPFKLDFINAEIGDNIYVPISKLNEIRRNAIEILSEKIVAFYKRDKINVKYNFKPLKKAENSKITALVNTVEQFDVCLEYNVGRIYLENKSCFTDNLNEFAKKGHNKGIEVFLAMPWLERDIYKEETENIFKNCEKTEIDGYLIRNYGKLDTNKKIATDFTFNIFNSASNEFFKDKFDTVCLSPELNAEELKQVAEKKNEIFVYGRLPLMTTHQCPVGIYCGGKKNGRFCALKGNKDSFYLKDRKNVDFPVMTDCQRCYSVILNNAPISVLSKFNEIKEIGAEFYRLSFTLESGEEAKEILYSYDYMLNNSKADKRVKNIAQKMTEETGITNGHFFRGVL